MTQGEYARAATAMPVKTILLVLAITFGCACTAPLEHADWLLPVPDGTPVHEYAPVLPEDRDQGAVRLVEDLVIAGEQGGDEPLFYRASSVAVGPNGDIFVADSASASVVVFDADGRHLRTMGRQGQGPGEFQSIWRMAIAADRLIVDDRGNQRFSAWTLSGEHLADHPKGFNYVLTSMEGLTTGDLLTGFTERLPEKNLASVALHSRDGRELERLIELPSVPLIPDSSWDVSDMLQAFLKLLEQPRVLAAAGRGETVYLAPAGEHQVVAAKPTGEVLWAARVAWSRPPVPNLVKLDVLSRSGAAAQGIGVEAVDWPDDYAAVTALKADGLGRVFVFLTPTDTEETPPAHVPVDVFSPEGEFLVAGYLPARWVEGRGLLSSPWHASLGEFVYSLRDDDRGERVVVRSRLLIDRG